MYLASRDSTKIQAKTNLIRMIEPLDNQDADGRTEQ